MDNIRIPVSKVLEIQKLLLRKDYAEAFRKKVFQLIVREMVLSCCEKNLPGSSAVDVLSNSIRDNGPFIKYATDWKHIFNSCLAMKPHGKSAKSLLEYAKEVGGKIEELEKEQKSLSFWKPGNIKRWRMLKKQKEELLHQEVRFKTFVEVAWQLYIKKGLGKKMDFIRELVASAPSWEKGRSFNESSVLQQLGKNVSGKLLGRFQKFCRQEVSLSC